MDDVIKKVWQEDEDVINSLEETNQIIEPDDDPSIPKKDDDLGEGGIAIEEDIQNGQIVLPDNEDIINDDVEDDLTEYAVAVEEQEPVPIISNQELLPTIGSVKQGQRVMIALINGEPTVIGTVGSGDRLDTELTQVAADLEIIGDAVVTAQEAANDAQQAANHAQDIADDIENQLRTVEGYVATAQSAADNAQRQADKAFNSATSANTQLSQIQKVMDVLQWAAEHGEYILTADTEVIRDKYYFELQGGKYLVVDNPTSNPSLAGYYELDGVDESITRYVASHLTLTDDGLFVQVDNQSSRLQLSGDGVYLYTSEGCIASYGDDVTLGLQNDVHLVLSPNDGLQFYDERNNKVAWITSNVLHIEQAEISNSMRIGMFMWKVQGNNRISLVYSPS